MNLLTDPLVTVRTAEGTRRLTLPDLLTALLISEAVQGLPRLGAHQRSYWWRFLVRCAARALRTADLRPKAHTELGSQELSRTISRALLEHTEEGDWDLYHPDPGHAAFLQPPTPGGDPPGDDRYKVNSAALLTAVIGTKQHERKSEVGRRLDPESAVYALVEFQGGVIFGGRGNYESQLTGSRSGAGSGTPFMGTWIDGSHGASFRHDVAVLLDRWDDNAELLRGDIWALWTRRWDGKTPTPATDLDPAFIPLARMVRVGEPRESLFDTVWFRPSKGSRVSDPTGGGNLGDPFTPLVPDPNTEQLKVRGTLAKGYDYKEVVQLLLPKDAEEAVRSPSVASALLSPPEAGDLRVIFEGMAFEQGKTRGFHRRVVRLPMKAVQSGLLSFRSEPLHAAHEGMLRYTDAAKRTLRASLALLLSGQTRARDDDRKKMGPTMDRVEEVVDRHYLRFLFDVHGVDEDADLTLPYREWLYESLVHEIFPEALSSLPRSYGRRWDEEVSAEAYLRGRLRNELDLSKPDSSKEDAA